MIFAKYASILAVFLLVGSIITPCLADESVQSSATSANTQSKEDFVKSMTASVLATVHDSNKSFVQKQAILVKTFTDVVDTSWIARFVLGKTWNMATDEQKEQYTALYRTYLTNTYVANFDEETANKLQDIKILGLSDADDDRFVVHSEMVMATGENVKVDYLLHDKDGQYKIIDIVAEGVSLLATHRSQFSELASAGGVSGVIEKLHQMSSSKQSTVAELTK